MAKQSVWRQTAELSRQNRILEATDKVLSNPAATEQAKENRRRVLNTNAGERSHATSPDFSDLREVGKAVLGEAACQSDDAAVTEYLARYHRRKP